MDIYQISLEFRVPLHKLRRMERAGILIVTPTREATSKIQAILAKGNRLPVLDLLALLRSPGVLDDLPPTYRAKAKEQLARLGNVAAGSMGENAATLILGAATLDPDALGTFARALVDLIPPEGCSHAYLASRALWGVPPARLGDTNRLFRAAMTNAKRHPVMAGAFSIRDKQTHFERPKTLDL